MMKIKASSDGLITLVPDQDTVLPQRTSWATVRVAGDDVPSVGDIAIIRYMNDGVNDLALIKCKGKSNTQYHFIGLNLFTNQLFVYSGDMNAPPPIVNALGLQVVVVIETSNGDIQWT